MSVIANIGEVNVFKVGAKITGVIQTAVKED